MPFVVIIIEICERKYVFLCYYFKREKLNNQIMKNKALKIFEYTSSANNKF